MQSVRRYSSKKRDAIYQMLLRSKDHPSADMLFSRLKPIYPALSNSTVYRCLAGFCEEGSAVVVGTVDNCDRFDACTSPHPHFICTECGTVSDLSLPDEPSVLSPDVLAEKIARQSGYQVSYWFLSFHGICPACRADAHNN